ncbi:zinc ribbon domain-containing protein [Lacticaseibacillus parahuelsenbergensis]|uniref:Zinc ribbon domain-containing protein n=1 Tax=Lacticaseibacillus parahuelsenbergensis TaxID=3068305 RepID=A0ABY9L0M8_9LACO|nr:MULTISPECIES: zinc ribbon domain-containing protein [Lacticaseibacillus]MDE3283078.1 zinc ribbon domain-containing protein [Lacticaseibacillus casei]WLV77215.1 zinc ribbon domain-containing protein [Lacticaseibacillus sp. NCIMB 15471]
MAFCPNCGAQVSADETFCHQCGFNLAQYRSQHQGTDPENGSSNANASSVGPTPQPTGQGAVSPNTRRQRSNGSAPNGPRRPWLMVSLVLAAAVIVVIAVLFFQNQSQQTQEAAASSASASAANASSASFVSASASTSQASASSSLAASQEAASESLANASESAAAESHESTTTTGGSDLSNRQVAKMAADLDDFDLDDYRVEVTSPATNMKEVDVYDKDDGELHNKYRYDEIHDQMSKYDDDSGKWELIQDDDD